MKLSLGQASLLIGVERGVCIFVVGVLFGWLFTYVPAPLGLEKEPPTFPSLGQPSQYSSNKRHFQAFVSLIAITTLLYCHCFEAASFYARVS